jgi:hypothetical protein
LYCLLSSAGALFNPQPAWGQTALPPAQVGEIRESIGNRIEALTILGGDFGFSDGHLTLSGALFPGVASTAHVDSTKFGGYGDVGDPQPLGAYAVGWQPHLQGDMGYLSLTDNLKSSFLSGDTSRFTDRSIEFGGGVRLWANASLSFAPTLMGVYGQADNEFLAPSNAAISADQLQKLGLVDWHVDVWAVRPALNTQYVALIDRTLVTFSSDVTYFHTENFDSHAAIYIDGNSGFVTNKVDIDIPLGFQLGDHEVRTGGYLARTDLWGDLEQGLDVQHLYEVHTRLVLDFLDELWKFQWIGVGASYLWGPGVHGWTSGVDVAFRF